MAIFSRRTLQRLIDENATFMRKDQLEKHKRKLNEADLSFEWEVVLLNVFSKLGKVIHEPVFENCSRKIDILFSTKIKDEIEFLTDITTISTDVKFGFAHWTKSSRNTKPLIQVTWGKNSRSGREHRTAGAASCRRQTPECGRYAVASKGDGPPG